MIVRGKIRSLMFIGAALLCLIVAVLSAASIQGALKFRKLTKTIRERGTELPLAAELSQQVNKLRATHWHCISSRRLPGQLGPFQHSQTFPRYEFQENLRSVESAIASYVRQLDSIASADPEISDTTQERELVSRIEDSMQSVFTLVQDSGWDWGGHELESRLEDVLEGIQKDASLLPSLMKDRMDDFADRARVEYHTWMTLTVIMTMIGVGFLGVLIFVFHRSVFRPLQQLLNGSRQVANGNFDYRIALNSQDEMAELADALNAMTANFQTIKLDLNHQVKQRTKEVVRSEQMASVGFLAAGVAHEINNPLATIAWSAEALESRLLEILQPTSERSEPDRQQDIATMKKYLRRIQDEAFRCKGITGSLLDFSRLGDAKKTQVDLRGIIESVVEMVRPLGRYRRRHIEFRCDHPAMIVANPQELKQVALNLITNALDSVEDGGRVEIRLQRESNQIVLEVQDNGCGMTDEVMQHLFEPFFTRRREGQGTGLGLSISYRIIEEHGGQIEPYSNGPGQGSTFRVRLPLQHHEQKQLPKIAA